MKSEQINELATALSKAQAAMKGAVKDSLNPHFKSKFADLEAIWDSCREALTSNGLSVMQPIEKTVDGWVMKTILAHSSGQWMSSSFPLSVPDKATPQAYGSACTYARRYSMAALVGCVQTDDDGEAAEMRGQQQPQTPKPIPVQSLLKKITPQQLHAMIQYFDTRSEDLQKALIYYDVTNLNQLDFESANSILKAIEGKKS